MIACKHMRNAAICACRSFCWAACCVICNTQLHAMTTVLCTSCSRAWIALHHLSSAGSLQSFHGPSEAERIKAHYAAKREGAELRRLGMAFWKPRPVPLSDSGDGVDSDLSDSDTSLGSAQGDASASKQRGSVHFPAAPRMESALSRRRASAAPCYNRRSSIRLAAQDSGPAILLRNADSKQDRTSISGAAAADPDHSSERQAPAAAAAQLPFLQPAPGAVVHRSKPWLAAAPASLQRAMARHAQHKHDVHTAVSQPRSACSSASPGAPRRVSAATQQAHDGQRRAQSARSPHRHASPHSSARQPALPVLYELDAESDMSAHANRRGNAGSLRAARHQRTKSSKKQAPQKPHYEPAVPDRVWMMASSGHPLRPPRSKSPRAKAHAATEGKPRAESPARTTTKPDPDAVSYAVHSALPAHQPGSVTNCDEAPAAAAGNGLAGNAANELGSAGTIAHAPQAGADGGNEQEHENAYTPPPPATAPARLSSYGGDVVSSAGEFAGAPQHSSEQEAEPKLELPGTGNVSEGEAEKAAHSAEDQAEAAQLFAENRRLCERAAELRNSAAAAMQVQEG